MADPNPAPETSTSWHATAMGLDAAHIGRHAHEGGIVYIYLDAGGSMSIRVELAPREGQDPARHAAELERDRKGLRALAAACTRLAQDIERAQRAASGPEASAA